MATAEQIAQEHADRGFDVYQRNAGDVILEIPNPRPWDDDYYHGENPNRVGYGSRGPASENATANPDERRIDQGEMTADAQARLGGLGWNEQAGPGTPESGSDHVTGETQDETTGEPEPTAPDPTAPEQQPDAQPDAQDEGGDQPDGSWTNEELREYADEHGIDIGNARNKSELLGAINAHRAQAGA